MKYHLFVNKNISLSTIECSGESSLKSLKDMTFHVINKQELIFNNLLLVDLRECTSKLLSSSDIQDFSQFIASNANKIGVKKIAAIVSTALDYGMARMWQIKTECETSFAIRISYNMEESKKWLLSP